MSAYTIMKRRGVWQRVGVGGRGVGAREPRRQMCVYVRACVIHYMTMISISEVQQRQEGRAKEAREEHGQGWRKL